MIAWWIASIAVCSGLTTEEPSPVAPDAVRAEFERMEAGLADWRPKDRLYMADFRLLLSQAVSPESMLLPEDRDPVDVVLRRTAALLACLRERPGAGDFRREDGKLLELAREASRVPVDDRAARFELFSRTAALRRCIAFRNPLLRGIDRILFVRRHQARYDHMCDQFYGHNAVPGGGLFVLEDPFWKPRVRNLLEGAVCQGGRLGGRKLDTGAVVSVDVSFDGSRVLFAYTEADLEGTPWDGERGKWAPRCTYHIFSVAADGTGLRQLTDGPLNDFDPCWLPDGRIGFISERRGGYLRCSGQRPCPLYTLHSMKDDGTDIVRLSPHESHEWGPSVDGDGMLLFTRWDYVDRGGNQAHHPWRMSPDGRDARAIHGNYPPDTRARPCMELGVRAIPGSSKLVAIAAAHHGQAYGSLITIDPGIPDDDGMSQVRRITPDARFPECEVGAGNDWYYATPWPLDETFFLCAYSQAGRGGSYGIWLVDVFGNREPILHDGGVSCWSPIPLAPRRRPPVLPSARGRVATPAPDGSATAVVVVTNVYRSRQPFPAGARIAALRIIQVLPKTTPVHHVPQIGYGCETSARAVLGTVPVEEDGSACFTVPAGKGIYFQALDERHRAVQSMRSETWAQPGEILACGGCHDPRSEVAASPSGPPLATRRPPSQIRPEPSGSIPFSFPLLVQPVLESRCAPCHEKSAGKAPDLSRGDWANDPLRWYRSYRSLMPYAFHHGIERYGPNDYDGWSSSRTTPGGFGALASKLLPMLEAGHHDARLTDEEMHRIILWLDCNSDFFGSYEGIEAQSAGGIVRPTLE